MPSKQYSGEATAKLSFWSVAKNLVPPRRGTACCAQSPFFKGGVGGLRVPNPLSPGGRDKSEGVTHNMSLRGVPKSRDDAAISTLLYQAPLTNGILSFSEEYRPPCTPLFPSGRDKSEGVLTICHCEESRRVGTTRQSPRYCVSHPLQMSF